MAKRSLSQLQRDIEDAREKQDKRSRVEQDIALARTPVTQNTPQTTSTEGRSRPALESKLESVLNSDETRNVKEQKKRRDEVESSASSAPTRTDTTVQKEEQKSRKLEATSTAKTETTQKKEDKKRWSSARSVEKNAASAQAAKAVRDAREENPALLGRREVQSDPTRYDREHYDPNEGMGFTNHYSEEYGQRLKRRMDELDQNLQNSLDNARINGTSNPREQYDLWRTERRNLQEQYNRWERDMYSAAQQRALAEISDDDLALIDRYYINNFKVNASGGIQYVENSDEVQRQLREDRQELLDRFGRDKMNSLLEYRGRQLDAQRQAAWNEELARRTEGYGAASAFAGNVGSVLTNAVAGPMAAVDIIGQAFNPNRHAPLNTNSPGFAAQNATQAIRGRTSEMILGDEENPNLGRKIGNMLYQTGMSAADSVAAMAVGGRAGGALLGINAATSAAQDITERGGSYEQAVTGGIASGIFESLFETVSIGNFYKLQETAVHGIRDVLGNMAKSGIVNLSEEALTEAANILYDTAVLGDLSNYQIRLREMMSQGLSEDEAKQQLARELGMQVAESGASGAIMGLFFGAAGSGISYADGRASAQTAQQAVLEPAGAELFRQEAEQAEQRQVQAAQEAERAQRDAMEAEAARQAAEEEARRQAAMRQQAEAEVVRQAEARRQAEAQAAQPQPMAPLEVEGAELFPENQARAAMETAEGIVEGARELAEDPARQAELIQSEVSTLRREGRGDVADALENILRESYNGNTRGGVENAERPGADRIPYESSERDAGRSARGSDRRLAGSSGRDSGADGSRNVQAEYAARRRSQARDQGASRESTRQATGQVNGATDDEVYRIRPENYDDELKTIKRDAEANGYKVNPVVGIMHFISRKGRRFTADGIYSRGELTFRADSDTTTATQFANHEMFHGIAADNPGLVDRLCADILSNESDEQLDQHVQRYAQAHDGIRYDRSVLLEELCADIYAQRSRFGVDLTQYSGAMRGLTSELTDTLPIGTRGGMADTGLTVDGAEYFQGDTGQALVGQEESGRYSVAGVRSRTADQELLSEAEDLAAQNVSNEEVYRDTGWYQGGDNRWRYEIDDSQMRVYPNGDAQMRRGNPEHTRYHELLDRVFFGDGGTAEERSELIDLDKRWSAEEKRLSVRVAQGNATLQDVVDHLELFAAYPELKDVKVQFEDYTSGKKAGYNPKTNTITLDSKLTVQAMRDALLHELQHIIQKIEGHARGASPAYWEAIKQSSINLKNNKDILESEINALNYEFARKQEESGLSEFEERLYEQLTKNEISEEEYVRAIDQWVIENAPDLIPLSDELDELHALLEKLEQRAEYSKQYEDRNPVELYYNTYGEQEARNTVARRTMTKEKRMAQIPFSGDENSVYVNMFDEKNDTRYAISEEDQTRLSDRDQELEDQLTALEANKDTMDPAEYRVQWYNLATERAAVRGQMRELEGMAEAQDTEQNRADRARMQSELDQHKTRAKQLTQQVKEATTAYRADGDANHLAEADRLRDEARKERKEIRKLQRQIGEKTPKQKPNPTRSMRETGDRIMNLYRIRAGYRNETRAVLNDIMVRTLERGYVGESELNEVLEALYNTGVEVLPPDDPMYQDIAQTIRNSKVYVPQELRDEFGDDWQSFRRQMIGVGLQTSSNIEDLGVDSLNQELAEMYPGIFDEEETDRRKMLEDMVDAALRGRSEHVSLGEAAERQGFSSEEDFAALYSQVHRELQTFADKAGLETGLKESNDQYVKGLRKQHADELQRVREHRNQKIQEAYEHFRGLMDRDAVRREKAEADRKLRNAVERLRKRAKVNDQTLTRVLSEQDPAVQAIADKALASLDTMANKLTGKKRFQLTELKDMINERVANDPNFEVKESTKKALARLDQIHLNELSVEDVEAMRDAINRVSHDLEVADQMIADAWDEEVRTVAEQVKGEVDFAKGDRSSGRLRKLMNEESLSPSRALLRYVGYDRSGAMGRLVEGLEKGNIDEMGYRLHADLIFQDFLKKNQDWLKTAAGKNAETVKVSVPTAWLARNGAAPIFNKATGEVESTEIELTQMMLVQMARDLQNEQNMWHVLYGGYTLPDMDLYRKGKTQEAYTRAGKKTVKMPKEFVQQLVDEHLSEEGREYVKLLDQYYDGFSKEQINGVSRRLDGVDRALTQHYSPIRTDANFRGKTYNVFDGTLEGMGSLKNRVYYSGTPIILEDADATERWHRDNMARYVGYAIPLRDLKAVLSHKPGFDAETVDGEIGKKYGATAQNFISDLIALIETGELNGKGEDIFSKITGGYVRRVLMYNISSAMKQMAALPLAGSSLGQDAIAYALARPRKVSMDLVRKYTPYLDYRGAGYTYSELADYVRNQDGAQQSKLRQTLLGQNWLEAVDVWANRRLWAASEYVVQHRYGLKPGKKAEIDAGTDPYYKKVAEVFNRATFDTQTNSNTMSKPLVLARHNPILQPFTMFKTDALQLQGIARETFGALRTAKRHLEQANTQENQAKVVDAKKGLKRAVLGIALSSFVQSLLGMGAKWLRGDDDKYRDDEGELTLESAGKEMLKDSLSNIYGSVIFGDQIFGWIESKITGEKFWEPDIPSISTVVDTVKRLDNLFSNLGESVYTASQILKDQKEGQITLSSYLDMTRDSILGDLKSATEEIATFFGIPLKNMEKTWIGGLSHAFPQLQIVWSDIFGTQAKNNLTKLKGDALDAGIESYLTDALGDMDEDALDEIKRLYEQLGVSALPTNRSVPDAVTIGEDEESEEHKLTLYEGAEWQYRYRETTRAVIEDMLESSAYMDLGDEDRARAVKRAQEYAAAIASEELGKEPEKWIANAEKAVEAGVELADILAVRTYDAGDEIKMEDTKAFIGDLDETEETQAALYDQVTTSETHDKLVAVGLSDEDSMMIAWDIAQLKPEKDKTTVSPALKYGVILDSDISNKEKLLAISTIMKAPSFEKLQTLLDSGVTLDQWYDFYMYNRQDGTNQEENAAYIDRMRISDKQKDALWFYAGYKESTLEKKAPWHQ